MNRRQFINLAAESALASLLFSTRSFAKSSLETRINWTADGFNEEDYGEITLIRKAMQVVVDRLFDPRILENMHEVSPSAYVMGDAWAASGLEARGYPPVERFIDLQVDLLRDTNLPNIHVNAFSSANNIHGTAPTSTLLFRHVEGDYFRWNGNFQMSLNRHHFANSKYDYGYDEEYWAGVIVHEMAHNLGHSHPNDDYRYDYQIVGLKGAVIDNGRHVRGSHQGPSRCGAFCVDVPSDSEHGIQFTLSPGTYRVRPEATDEWSYSGEDRYGGPEGDRRKTDTGRALLPSGYFGQLLILVASRSGGARWCGYHPGMTISVGDGDRIVAVLNDRPGQFDDNRGTISVTFNPA